MGALTLASETLQSGREKRKVSAGAATPGTGFPVLCRSFRTFTEQRSRRFSAADCPKGTRNGRKIPAWHRQEQSWVSRKTETKAELRNRTDLTPPAPAYCRTRKCSRCFRGEEAVTQRGQWSGALRHDGNCRFSCFGFPFRARPLFCKLRSRAAEAAFASSSSQSWSSLPVAKPQRLSTP